MYIQELHWSLKMKNGIFLNNVCLQNSLLTDDLKKKIQKYKFKKCDFPAKPIPCSPGMFSILDVEFYCSNPVYDTLDKKHRYFKPK